MQQYPATIMPMKKFSLMYPNQIINYQMIFIKQISIFRNDEFVEISKDELYDLLDDGCTRVDISFEAGNPDHMIVGKIYK